MLRWTRNKNDARDGGAPTPDAADGRRPAAPAAPPIRPPDIDWRHKLDAAQGDDAALLALAREDAPVDVKLAAVGAIAGEAALKLAEREFRSHDRRVHSLLKQRLAAQTARRVAREQAGGLIDAAAALAAEPLIAANRLVEIDRAWQALDKALLDDVQRAEFLDLQARLTALTRERAERALAIERWNGRARQALAGLEAACNAAAAGAQERSDLAAAVDAARTVVASAPQGAAGALQDAIGGALGTSRQLDDRLAVLDELLRRPTAAQAAPAAEPAGEDSAAMAAQGEALATVAPDDAARRWQQFAPLADAALAAALNGRFERWRQAADDARQARRAQRREQARDRERTTRMERSVTLATALERAEAALAEGHLSDTNKVLVEIDELLHGGASAGALRARIDALQAEYARLRGWQHWGGGLARDELVLQAEALAAATGGAGEARIVKLSTKQRAEVIDELRARWKELDHLGGATSRALWQRFDAALAVAYEPVAAQVAAQRAAREQNLQARQQLIEALDAVALEDGEPGDAAPDCKALAWTLDHFHTEWRKLGPIEHTVPRKERDGLVERMGAAVARLEAPLDIARRGAQLRREQLIERARALGAETLRAPQGRDLVGRVRELQAEWQQQAKALPLARAAESALWSEFKAAVDAIFSARDAAFNAREAEFKAHGAERAALIERLDALNADTPPAELRRTLGEVDAQWQRVGPAPRADAAQLDARFRGAHEKARAWLAGSAQRHWHATCDAVLAKLALCEAMESSGDPAAEQTELAQRWPQQPALPASWEQALARRASLPGIDDREPPGRRATTDDLLVQLEIALQLDSPPEAQAARRELKLLAMKAALEGRPSAAPKPAIDALFATLLGRVALDSRERERLRAVVDALRKRGPAGAA